MTKDIYQEALDLHKKHAGKLAVRSKVPLTDRHDLSMAYTPGVAQVSREVSKDKKLAYQYTLKANTVAVVSDGTSVLGLGNIGPYGAIPVMEGKAILFKELADVDAFPICYEGKPEGLVDFVKGLAPVFGGINLEDISAPRCFEIEAALQDLGIPVMHDDQHGTAVVILAALLNASKVVGKRMQDLTVVINGAGAAGTAALRLLKCAGVNKKLCTPVNDVLVCDTKGIIHPGRADLATNTHKQQLAELSNNHNKQGTLADALRGADAFIGVSAPNIVTQDMVRTMNKNAIVLAMANPVPEIMPNLARDAGAAVVGTGRSDFPNQINNALGFPGIFRGALDAKATRITNEMKIAAAHALANYVKKPTTKHIIPDVLDKAVAMAVAEAVAAAAKNAN